MAYDFKIKMSHSDSETPHFSIQLSSTVSLLRTYYVQNCANHSSYDLIISWEDRQVFIWKSGWLNKWCKSDKSKLLLKGKQRGD